MVDKNLRIIFVFLDPKLYLAYGVDVRGGTLRYCFCFQFIVSRLKAAKKTGQRFTQNETPNSWFFVLKMQIRFYCSQLY